MTTTFEELFNQSVLSVVAPHASLGLPKQSDNLETWSEWLNRLEQEPTDRRTAFFGKVHTTRTPKLLDSYLSRAAVPGLCRTHNGRVHEHGARRPTCDRDNARYRNTD